MNNNVLSNSVVSKPFTIQFKDNKQFEERILKALLKLPVIDSAEYLLLGNVFVNNHGFVDEYFRNSRILCHHGDELEHVIQRLLFVGHRLPRRPSADFFHFMRRFRRTQNFASKRGFYQQRIDWVAATGGVVCILIVGAEIPPFGRIIESVLVNDSARRVCARGESVVHEGKYRIA